MKYLRYYAEFKSRDNNDYRIEILQENTIAYQAQEIFLSSNPVEIEWKEIDKIDPIHSSSATINLLSDSDRKFIDLYTVKVGDVRLDIYRSNQIYWSGIIDTELYEEPYSETNNYDVSLTFSDFAHLDRMKFNKLGFINLRQLLTEIINATGINYKQITEVISTKLLSTSVGTILDDVALLCENFYDEDKIPMTLREILEDVLKPFSLKIEQKQGAIFIYDLNAIYDTVQTQIEWNDVDALLGVDKTYNNVKITFSPYEKSELMNVEIPENLKCGTPGQVVVPDSNIPGFEFYLSNYSDDQVTVSLGKLFKIKSIYSGSDCAGIAYTVRMKYGENPNTPYTDWLLSPTSSIGREIFKVNSKPFVSAVTISDNRKLKISVDMMFDVRYNPFESSSYNNEEGSWNCLRNWCNLAYIPIKLTLRDAAGNALKHYENKGVKNYYGLMPKPSDYLGPGWYDGDAQWGDAWLCWYDNGNRKSETGLGGFKENKQTIGFYQDGLPAIYEKRGSGEYIDFPPMSGWIELAIGEGAIIWDYGRQQRDDIFRRTRWILFKNPCIKVVDVNGKDIDPNDIELSAWINPNAKEEMKIDTKIGTLSSDSAIAIGQIFRNADKYPILKFYRGGKLERLEKLMIGTIYSNYAKRNATLSGTVRILPEFSICSEKNHPGKFFILSEIQYLADDESEIKMVTFDKDNYDGIEYL